MCHRCGNVLLPRVSVQQRQQEAVLTCHRCVSGVVSEDIGAVTSTVCDIYFICAVRVLLPSIPVNSEKPWGARRSSSSSRHLQRQTPQATTRPRSVPPWRVVSFLYLVSGHGAREWWGAASNRVSTSRPKFLWAVFPEKAAPRRSVGGTRSPHGAARGCLPPLVSVPLETSVMCVEWRLGEN